jgi:hypothetical protein
MARLGFSEAEIAGKEFGWQTTQEFHLLYVLSINDEEKLGACDEC